jgi:hypothetical protein
MSHSLDLIFKPAIRRDRLLAHFSGRKHVTIAQDTVRYGSKDTGAYFFVKLRCSRNLLLQRTVTAAETEVNYVRPSFFGLEAEKEIAALVAAFRPQIFDSQIQGMGEGPYSTDGFLSGWNFGNLFSVRSILSSGSDPTLLSMPAEELRAAWMWNYRRAELQTLWPHCFVPIIMIFRIDGRLRRAVVWGEGMPVLLPRVDCVLVVPDGSRAKRIGLASWSEIVALAKRAGFDTAKDPLELLYLVPPPAIADWVANIAPIDEAAIKQIPPSEIIDDEVIAAARAEIENGTSQAEPL